MTIITNSSNTDDINQACISIDIQQIKLNQDRIKLEIQRIKDAIDVSTSKKQIQSGKKLVKVFSNIIKNTDSDGYYRYCWNVKDNKLSAYPDTIIEDKQLGLTISCAVIKDGSIKVVELKLDDILNMMALEYGRKEIGYNTDKLNTVMNNIGIAGLYSTNDIRTVISDFDKLYKLVGNKEVINSEYRYGCKMQGYFNNTVYELDKYKKYGKIINETCHIISSIIALRTIKAIAKDDSNAALISVGKDKITMSTSISTDINRYIDSYAIKILGRQFKIGTTILEEI